MKIKNVIDGAVGPFDNYCDGYGNPGASGLGYISVLTIETGKVEKRLDEELEAIVAYDRAEANGTYIGQINMLQASSFCGLNGAVWGYHLAKADNLLSIKPLWKVQRHNGFEMSVYDCKPLLDAGKSLFGTSNARRFPLLPGAHVKCAVKSIHKTGPCRIWCAAALAISENREINANLFVEDVGYADNSIDPDQLGQSIMKNLVKSVIMVGKNQNAHYKETFVGYRHEWLNENESGCALIAAPYIVLAKKAVPPQGVTSLMNMTISEWEQSVGISAHKD